MVLSAHGLSREASKRDPRETHFSQVKEKTMKKYAAVCALFLFNAEIISWLALLIIVAMLLADFGKRIMEEARK
jgi:hypothetical protein